jgi:CheY-like chemotaxis protein
VYGFVKQSGGHVKLYSEPGFGTTARIYLPKARATAGPAPLPMTDARKTDQTPRGSSAEAILVVEDDQDVRNYAVGSLRELGYVVLEAGDATAALAIIAREPGIRLLFTDLGLPGGIDGRVLAERATAARPELKVLITTAYAGNALVHEGRLDPGVELLAKPFSFPALANRVREVLDRDPPLQRQACVLVVDDEPLLQTLFMDALAYVGCETAKAASFSEALVKMREIGDELAGAVIDLGLPDRPGDELIAHIRKSRSHMPIILTTGFSGNQARERFASDPRVQVLAKPFDQEGLMAALRRFGGLVRAVK